MSTVVRGQTIQVSVEMVTEECCNCGVIFAMTRDFKDEKLKYRNDHNRRSFYCPNGHSQFYLGETEEQKLKRQLREKVERENYLRSQLESSREEANHQRNRANGYKGLATKVGRRAKAGVCPCCNRSFENLRRHMQSQHPTFTEEGEHA